ncbi:hypothetical protein AB0L44_00185 [Nonomuraea wenchangensis]|uniref:hypothetical protein n=1 Tax=Nonomuraea wenchangensis TaxID=568860 RepID=UPI00341A9849
MAVSQSGRTEEEGSCERGSVAEGGPVEAGEPLEGGAAESSLADPAVGQVQFHQPRAGEVEVDAGPEGGGRRLLGPAPAQMIAQDSLGGDADLKLLRIDECPELPFPIIRSSTVWRAAVGVGGLRWRAVGEWGRHAQIGADHVHDRLPVLRVVLRDAFQGVEPGQAYRGLVMAELVGGFGVQLGHALLCGVVLLMSLGALTQPLAAHSQQQCHQPGGAGAHGQTSLDRVQPQLDPFGGVRCGVGQSQQHRCGSPHGDDDERDPDQYPCPRQHAQLRPAVLLWFAQQQSQAGHSQCDGCQRDHAPERNVRNYFRCSGPFGLQCGHRRGHGCHQ